MRAVVQSRYGATADLVVQDVPVPEPAPDEVLVRVLSASVHPDVWHVVTGRPDVLRLMGSGLRRPKVRVPGTDLAGIVERVSSAVTRFRPGDEVFGEAIRGVQWVNSDVRRARDRARGGSRPEALQRLLRGGGRRADRRADRAAEPRERRGDPARPAGAGQRAAGGVGRARGAGGSGRGRDRHRRWTAPPRRTSTPTGADRFLDFTTADFTRGPDRYDLVFDVPGNHPLRAVRRVIAPGGRYVLIGHDAFGTVGRRWLGSIPRFVRLMAMSSSSRSCRGRTSRPRTRPRRWRGSRSCWPRAGSPR